MTIAEWDRIARDDLEFVECIGYALGEKADQEALPESSKLGAREAAVLNLWTYLATNPEWYPMPVSRDAVVNALDLLGLTHIREKIPTDLRSPVTAEAGELLKALADWLRAHPEEMDLDRQLDSQRTWMSERKATTPTPMPIEKMAAIFRMQPARGSED